MLLDALVGIAFIGVALALRRAPRPMRIWWAAVGAAWWLGDVPPLRVVHQGVLIGALAGFPIGVLRTRGQLLTLGAGAVVGAGFLGQAGSAVGFLVCAGIGAQRSVSARLGAAAVGLWLAGIFVWSRASPDTFQPLTALAIYEVILLTIALTLPWGVSAEARRRVALSDRVLAGSPTGLTGLENALRGVLGRRTLRLVRNGSEVVVEGLGLADAETLAAVDKAVSLTIAHERALAESAGRLGELREARARVLAAADVERDRAARLLRHELATLRSSQVAVSELPDIAREVGAAVADIERIVAALPPNGLGAGGIGPALAQLCARHPVPVLLDLDERAKGDQACEAALFYACSEALANSAKHANAHAVVVTLEAGDSLVLTVADDGVGLADPRGTGLVGLVDRLATVGGTLAVDSRSGIGTRVVAQVPRLR